MEEIAESGCTVDLFASPSKTRYVIYTAPCLRHKIYLRSISCKVFFPGGKISERNDVSCPLSTEVANTGGKRVHITDLQTPEIQRSR